jgi:hypothetical protein
MEKHIGESTNIITHLYRPLYQLLFATFFTLNDISSEMTARVYRLQVHFFLILYAGRRDLVSFEILLASREMSHPNSLQSFFNVFTEVMIGGVTFPVVPFKIPTVKNDMLTDGSQRAICGRIQTALKDGNLSFIATYSGLLRWVDISVLAEIGADSFLCDLLYSRDEYAFQVLQDLCSDERLFISDRAARFNLLTNGGSLIATYCSVVPLSFLSSVMQIHSAINIDIFNSIIRHSITQPLEPTHCMAIGNLAKHDDRFKRDAFLDFAHDYITGILDGEQVEPLISSLGAVCCVLGTVPCQWLVFFQSLEPFVSSIRAQHMLIAVRAIVDYLPLDSRPPVTIIMFFFDAFAPNPAERGPDIFIPLFHIAVSYLPQATDSLFLSVWKLAYGCYEDALEEPDFVNSLIVLLRESPQSRQPDLVPFSNNFHAKFIAKLLLSGVPVFIRACIPHVSHLPHDIPWAEMYKYYGILDKSGSNVLLALLGLLEVLPDAETAWDFALMLAVPCLSLDDKTLVEPFLIAVGRFGDRAVKSWFLFDSQFSNETVRVLMCRQPWYSGNASIYLAADEFRRDVFTDSELDRRIFAYLQEQLYRPDTTELFIGVFTWESVHRAIAILRNDSSDETIQEITRDIERILTHVKVTAPRVYTSLFSLVQDTPASFARLFWDSFAQAFLDRVAALFRMSGLEHSHIWLALFAFQQKSREEWGIDLEEFPCAKHPRVEPIARVWEIGLSGRLSGMPAFERALTEAASPLFLTD